MSNRVKIDKELESIVPPFIENRHLDYENLKKHLQEQDFGSIETIGHRLAGNAGGYGFDELGEIGKKLEQAAQEKNEQKIVTLTDKIRVYLDELEIIYE